jgi:hypothetical protein
LSIVAGEASGVARRRRDAGSRAARDLATQGD